MVIYIHRYMNLIVSTVTSKFFPGINKNPAFLTCPNGNILVHEVISNIDLEHIQNIFIVINKHDVEKQFTIEGLTELFTFEGKTTVVALVDTNTKSNPETIYNCVKKYDIEGPLVVKDFKTIIRCCPTPGNYVYYLDYKGRVNISKLYSKSFVVIDSLKKITNISEKDIISNNVCAGFYSFENAQTFVDKYEELLDIVHIDDNINVSHLIYACIVNKCIFYGREITDYIDLTYHEDWVNFCGRYKTLFVDIDGTLVLNSGEHAKERWGSTECIKKNVSLLKGLHSTGTVQIILTTARKAKYKNATIEQLEKSNIPYDDIIFDLYHCKRYLVNDFSPTNPYPSAIAVNLSRNSDDLESYFTPSKF